MIRPVTRWITRTWIGGAAAYLGSVFLLSIYAFGGDHIAAYLVLLGVTAPVGPILLYPIYFATGLADSVSGHGLDGSPASISVGIAGFMVAAAINVVLVRVAWTIVRPGRQSRVDAR